MTTPLEQAFPLASNWVAATVRSKLAECGIYCTDDPDLSAEDFTIQPWAAVAVFGADGDLEFYAFDATDTTTADDGGLTCIVASGRRYKKRIDAIVRDAALSATTSAQPASPSLGDTYIIPAAPSGTDWATQAKTVAMFTARGWLFRQPRVGMIVYVIDSDSFYRYTDAGVWVQGLGNAALPDGSVTPKKLFDPFVIFKVEGQNNAPPGGTPTVGTAYQVGTSPTGAFAGHTNEIARWNALGAWEFFQPAEGDIIVRKDDGSRPYSYRAGSWVLTVSPAAITRSYYVNDTVSATSTAALTNRLSSPTITAQVGQKIRVTVNIITATLTNSISGSIGLRLDTAGSMAKTLFTSLSAGTFTNLSFVVEIDAPDASGHIYRIASVANGLGWSAVTTRAIFEVVNPS